MDGLEPVPREEALRVIPDAPVTLEFRDMALDPRGAVFRSGAGLLMVHSRARLIGATGAVDARNVETAYQAGGFDCELLADRTAYDRLRGSFAFARAIIQTLAGPWQPAERRIAGLSIRRLKPSDALGHLPNALLGQLVRELEVRSVTAGFLDGVAVSFAYSSSNTETYSDVSIDTCEQHRGRGIAGAVVSALVEDIIAAGRTPVWGAVETNRPSLRLAEKLGFTRPAGELFVHEPD